VTGGDLRQLILNAARNLPYRGPAPGEWFRAKREPAPSAVRGIARLRMTTFATLLLAFVSIATTLPGQSAQPWNGRGIPAPQVSVAESTRPFVARNKTAGAKAVQMIGLTVSDMDRSINFFTRVLDFTKVSDDKVAGRAYESLEGVTGARLRVVRLRLGDELLQLTDYLAPESRPFPADSRSNDRWFQHIAIIVSDMDRAYAMLRKFKVQPASTAPQTLPKTIPNAAGIRAFYFRDPDGHFLEILQFPANKGDPKWQRRGGQLFLGIDHTAIVVRRTAESLAFYRDALGFRVAGESMNFGTEQEHLNNVGGARLHITGLRAEHGPGIEFLEYLTPTNGRAYPADERSTDVVHWETTIVVHDVASAARLLQRDQFRLLTPRPVELPDSTLGFERGILARDPDGHVVQLVEP
ncbi:MAG TPA: VOC family protein, partial [Gemmatimonadales bacterium]|nr:VOC family protein [Gemmatimonadales bacterium]